MESNEQNNLPNKIEQKHRYIEQTDSSQRGGGQGVGCKKDEGIKHVDTDKSMVIAREKGGLGEMEEGKGGINGAGKRWLSF